MKKGPWNSHETNEGYEFDKQNPTATASSSLNPGLEKSPTKTTQKRDASRLFAGPQGTTGETNTQENSMVWKRQNPKNPVKCHMASWKIPIF